ncbi:MAG: ribosome maturation factor RimP [Pseudomonadota bacterium]
MDLEALLDATLAGLGYELVDLEVSGKRRLLRVFIDKAGGAGGIGVDDCERVSHHLTRLFAVENVDYDRLEVSSPGLDRALKKERDFTRFAGEKVQVKLRLPLEGRKKFVGVLRGAAAGRLQVEVDGRLLALELSSLDKVRLVPEF